MSNLTRYRDDPTYDSSCRHRALETERNRGYRWVVCMDCYHRFFAVVEDDSLQRIADAWHNETHPVPTAWRESQDFVRRWMPELSVLLDVLVDDA